MAAVLPFLLVALIPASVVAALSGTGPVAWLPLAVVFGLVPLFDAWLPINHRDVSADHLSSWLFPALPRAWAVLQVGVLAWGIERVATSTDPLAWRVLWTLDLGVLTGSVGIVHAHELMHRVRRLDRVLAEVLMLSVTYPHFGIEHVAGHHRRVATPDDPATSRLGEGLYRFWARTLAGSLRSAWELERQRLTRKGRAWASPQNAFLRWGLVLAALYGGVGLWLGPAGVAVLAGQSLVAVLLLETINYVEHYGLLRARREDGRWERVQPWHSWNASHRVSNWMLLNLARHSDHHAEAARPYQALRHLDAAPQLPTGYGAMVLLATVPPLWRRVMDPRVEAWRRERLADGDPVRK